MVVLAAERAFYETSAQVIPVLLLVLAVEMARYQTPKEPLLSAYSFLSVVFGMIAAEVAALIALTSGSDSLILRTFTALGIGIGLSIVFLRAGLLVRANLARTHSEEVADRFEFRVTIASLVVLSAVTLALIVAGR